MKLTAACQACLYRNHKDHYPSDASPEKIRQYQTGILKIIADRLEATGPEVVYDIRKLQKELFQTPQDFSAIKSYYNRFMLTKEQEIWELIKKADDPLYKAIQYSLIGNYIDFGANSEVDDQVLEEMLQQSDHFLPDPFTYHHLRNDLASAHSIVFCTDNCGEIVFDKLLLRLIHEDYPHLEITIMVRGEPVINDATITDAYETDIGAYGRVIGNGSGIAGNVLSLMSQEARELITQADFTIAKGQGNYETLQYEPLNVYYLFLCKCDLFVQRFHVPRYTGLLVDQEAESS